MSDFVVGIEGVLTAAARSQETTRTYWRVARGRCFAPAFLPPTRSFFLIGSCFPGRRILSLVRRTRRASSSRRLNRRHGRSGRCVRPASPCHLAGRRHAAILGTVARPDRRLGWIDATDHRTGSRLVLRGLLDSNRLGYRLVDPKIRSCCLGLGCFPSVAPFLVGRREKGTGRRLLKSSPENAYLLLQPSAAPGLRQNSCHPYSRVTLCIGPERQRRKSGRRRARSLAPLM
jgi:hypothetical protein